MHGSIPFLFLWSHLMVALCCDSLAHYSHYSNISLTLANNMGGQLSDQDPPVSFPYRLYRRIRCVREEFQLIFVRESLELIFDLYYHDNNYPVTWEKDMTQRFLISIQRLMDTLDGCVTTKCKCVSKKKGRNVKLKKYYRRLIRKTVHYSQGSSESWKFLMRETKLHLEQLQLLVSFIQSSPEGTRCSRLL